VRTASPQAGDREDGAILVFALLLLALTSTTAAFAPRLATLELARSEAVDALSRADRAAATGLDLALGTSDLVTTAPTTLLTRDVLEGRVRVDAAFLGFRSRSDGGELVEWHFSLTAVGTSGRGARSIHRQQVYVLAPPPTDPDGCRDPGCAVPPACSAGAGCEADLRMPAVPVGWHLPADAT
jgi:hypothetical protein